MSAHLNSGGKPPIQVVLLFDSPVQPAWVLSAVTEIQRSPIAEISQVVCWQKASRCDQGALLYQAYRWLDRKLFERQIDPYALLPIEPVGVDRMVRFVSPAVIGGQYVFSEEQIRALGLNTADVALYFGELRIAGPILQAPKYGLWAYGGGYDQRHRAEGVWAVFEGIPTTSSALWILGDNPAADKPIYRSFAATDERSAQRNGAYLWKTARFAHRKLADLHREGEKALQPLQNRAASALVGERYQSPPNNTAMLGLLLQLIARYSKEKITHLFRPPQWFIAYGFGGGPAIADIPWQHLTYLKPPAGCQWADPFPWVQDGRPYIFIEEIPSPGAKGHIAVFDLNSTAIEDPRPTTVLKADFHLSHPFLFKWRGELYLLPESSRNRTVEVYRCRKFPDEWELYTRLFEGVKAVDTTIVQVEGTWWLFANIAEEGSSSNDELWLYYASCPFGPWVSHQENPVVSDVSRARPAGGIFLHGGSFYRPSQNCSVGYGYAITLNRILELTPETYREEPVAQVLPDWAPRLLATHTLNTHQGLTVLDGLAQ